MSSTQQRWEAALMANYGTPQLKLVRGQGCTVWDEQGRAYLDLLAGLAVNVLGHAHPRLVEAIQEQAATLAHVSNLYATDPALRLAERLHRLTGHKALLVNSGSEANEVAYKLVRRHAHARGDPEAVVLAFEGSFHGRTTGALALTGQPNKHAGFTPFPPTVAFVPYNDPEALEHAFQEHAVAGVFAEVVQGEGGVVPMDPGFATTLSTLTDEHDALLVVDEVQTGLGRTGSLFAHQQVGLDPDVVTLAKALGGGLPAGACLATPEVAALLDPGSHGCTFGGNPIADAAANVVLDVLEHERLSTRAAKLGKALTSAFAHHGLQARGLGLLQGLPLDAPVAGKAVAGCQKKGLLVGQAGDQVLRLAPPLVVEEEDLLAAVPLIAQAIEAAG